MRSLSFPIPIFLRAGFSQLWHLSATNKKENDGDNDDGEDTAENVKREASSAIHTGEQILRALTEQT